MMRTNESSGRPAPLKSRGKVATLLAVSSLMMSVLGCSKVNDMHDATMDMRQQTRDLGAQTNRLTENMGEMYDALKQGDSLMARRSSLQALVAARDSSRKISEAGKYFMAFEYQLWSGIGQDTPAKREEVAAAAAREFMRDVQEFMDANQTSVDPLATGEEGEGNRARCFNALAAALHILNTKQEQMLHRHPELKKITMYSMIQDAFKAKAEVTAGTKRAEDVSLTSREVLAFEGVARLLLQARYNFLGAMALAQVSPIRNGRLAYIRSRVLSWELDLSRFNFEEVRRFTDFLKAAVRTHEFMVSIGHQPVMNSTLHTLFSNMRLSAATQEQIRLARGASQNASAQVAVNAKAVADTEFVDFVQRYLASGGNASAVPAATAGAVGAGQAPSPAAQRPSLIRRFLNTVTGDTAQADGAGRAVDPARDVTTNPPADASPRVSNDDTANGACRNIPNRRGRCGSLGVRAPIYPDTEG